MNYAGILEPLLESLERNPPVGTHLVGQEVITARKEFGVVIALDEEQNVHFLLSPAPVNDDRFARFHLKALTIKHCEWSISGRQAMSYLDLACIGGVQPAMRRPFLSFCEDLLMELERPGTSPEDAAYRTCVRWQRFWSRDDDGVVATEWVRGLLGELRFLEYAIQSAGGSAVFAWTGPDARDHDFQTGTSVAFEVKTSANVPYTIECNLNQLDDAFFDTLYLVCFLAVRADTGEALPDAVTRIEAQLEDDEALDHFYTQLQKAGYRRHRRTDYEGLRLQMSGPEFFQVTADFPRITRGSFRTALDARVGPVRYQLQIAGVPSIAPDAEDLVKALANLSRTS